MTDYRANRQSLINLKDVEGIDLRTKLDVNMSYKIIVKKNRFGIYLLRFFQIIYALIFGFMIFIGGPKIIFIDKEIIWGLSWIILPILMGFPVLLLFEYGIRHVTIKEVIINDKSITLYYNKKKGINIPFNAIIKREIDGDGFIHYITNLNFKAHPLLKKGTISSMLLDEEIIKIIDKNINQKLL